MSSRQSRLEFGIGMMLIILSASGCDPTTGILNVAEPLKFSSDPSGGSAQTLASGQYVVEANFEANSVKLSLKAADGKLPDVVLPIPDALGATAEGSLSFSAAESGIGYDIKASIETSHSFGPEINTSEPCTWTTTVNHCEQYRGDSSKQCSDQSITHSGMHFVRYRERTETKNIHVSLYSPGSVTSAAEFEGTAREKSNRYDRTDACE